MDRYQSGGTLAVRRPDRDLCARRQPDISFSHGAEWKALISTYMETIPFSSDPCCAAVQNMSGGPPLKAAVTNAMIANVGAAARTASSPRLP